MAKIRAKLKQLRDADVRFISLVDRAATRIPFRVLKREKENKMGIDLTKVFKSDDTRKPYVSALVVFAQKDETAGKQVVEAIQKHGFKTDRVQKSDEGETLVFAQADKTDDSMIVRLSDQMLVNVANLQTPGGWMGEFIKENGFFPDLKTATAALQDQMAEVVAKSETPQDDALAVLTSYAEYLNEMVILPANAFKLEEAIAEIAKKCSCEDEKAAEKDDEEDEDDDEKEPASKEEETDEAKKKRLKNHPPSEMAPKDEEDDQKPPPDDKSPAEKADKDKKPVVKIVKSEKDVAILAALKSIEATVTGLTTKVETVITEQATQKKVLDEVVQKTDTLGTKLGETVIAPPVSEDRPAGDGTRMRVAKQDDDPRTGNFDTAFLRRRR
jgi:hypothetical protein